MPSFFDRLAVYSSDYIKFLNKNFLQKNKNNIDVHCKSSFDDIISLFANMQTYHRNKHMRLNFHAVYGNQYNNAYIDAIHIDDDILYNLVFAENLQAFLKNIECRAIPAVRKMIIENVENHLKIFSTIDKKNLFVRTIKHRMTQNEATDLLNVEALIRNVFKKSKLLVITDVKDNLKYSNKIIKYMKFDHWNINKESINRFNTLIVNAL